MKRATGTITVNRAPVLTLWAAVVAQRLGFRWAEALTLGKALAGLNAQSKGRALGIYPTTGPVKVSGGRRGSESGTSARVELLGRAIPAVKTPDGLRALARRTPIAPESVERYLESKFKDDLGATTAAMRDLARSVKPSDLTERGFALYEEFRPRIAAGTRGWGKAGVLDLGAIRALARKGSDS